MLSVVPAFIVAVPPESMTMVRMPVMVFPSSPSSSDPPARTIRNGSAHAKAPVVSKSTDSIWSEP